MGLLDELRRIFGSLLVPATAEAAGTSGRPTSSNGASSHHLFWQVDVAAAIVEVTATLEVLVRPSTSRLCFWALQASFADGGRTFGGAHLGLQHHPQYPDSAAANWGGYHDQSRGGGVLDGTPLSVPSALGNANTGNYAWQPNTPYVLRIARGGNGWLGSITDPYGTETILRELFCEGSALVSPSVWTESFADCDAPPATVRWSDCAVITASGVRHAATSMRVNYQRLTDGGCSTSDSVVDPGSVDAGGAAGVLQQTGVVRTTPQGAVLRL